MKEVGSCLDMGGGQGGERETGGVLKQMSNHNNESWTLAPTRSCPLTTAPSWLLCTLADLEERMKALAMNPEEDNRGDTFAQRAESYYQRRPRLLFLLQDLYKSFVYLSERYVQLLSKQNGSRRNSLVSSMTEENSCSDKEDDGCISHVDFSDAESSLSYQHSIRMNGMWLSSEWVVAELVIKNVEHNIMLHELEMTERQSNDSSRKITLQRSLLEVLESERLILLHENGRLGYKVSALAEENHELASESMYVKRMAGELARGMIKMREDQRVSMLSRRIEDLQGQVRGLEKRNEEYHKQIAGRDREAGGKQRKDNGEVTVEVCLQMGKLKLRDGEPCKNGNGKKLFKWWEKVKKMDIFVCGIQTDIS